MGKEWGVSKYTLYIMKNKSHKTTGNMKGTILHRMNNGFTASALLLVLAGGCAAPQSAYQADTTEATAAGTIAPFGLSRIAQIAQLQVDAVGVYARMIEYFMPEEQAVPAVISVPERPLATRRLDAFLRFKPGSSDLLPGYSGNRNELARIQKELAALTGGETVDIQSIRISGYASPDGNTARNEELAAARALRFRNYLAGELRPVDKEMLQVDLCAEDWHGLVELTRAERKPYATRVAAVLDSVSDPDRRRKALRALDKGAVWNDMEKTLFARLRRMQLDVTYRLPDDAPLQTTLAGALPTSGMEQLLSRFQSAPDALTLNELLQIAIAYRPGTEQYREVYELAAYRFPDDTIAQLNAAAAALAQNDTESARYFLTCVDNDPRAWINKGVLTLMEGNAAEAADCFRKSLSRKPRLARENLRVATQIMNNK